MPKPLFLSALTILLLARAVFAGEPNTLTSEETAAGWKLLFDGKSTAGWVAIGKPAFPDKGWSVREGALHHEKGGGGGDIVTTESYGSFELQFEWRIGAIGNSGVKYNLIDPAKALGFEYQLIDEKHSDAIKGGALRQTASLYDLIAPTGGHKVSPVGEWNQSRLRVEGNRVEQWLNGVKTVAFEIGSEELKALVAKSKYKNIPGFGLKKSSPILLQDHGDEVTFRNVKLRVLP